MPASEDAFQQGREEATVFFTSDMDQTGREYSSFAGRVLAARLIYRTTQHTSRNLAEENPGDFKNGEFWRRHRAIDNDLVMMRASLPLDLQLSRNFRCQNAIFVNALICTSVICLHRAALSKMDLLEAPAHMIHQSQTRLIAAAEEVISILKITDDLHTALQNPILDFSTYMAAVVFLEDFTAENSDQSKDNLVFLLNVTITMGKSHPVVRLLAYQLAMDMRQSGIDSPVVQQVCIRVFMQQSLN